jgi:hypothetical protein
MIVRQVLTYVANAPSDCTLLARGGSLISLAFYTWREFRIPSSSSLKGDKLTKIHDMVSADGTVVHDNVPRPQGDSVPLTLRQYLILYTPRNS